MAANKMDPGTRQAIAERFFDLISNNSGEMSEKKKRLAAEIRREQCDRFSVQQVTAVMSQVRIRLRDGVSKMLGLSDKDIDPHLIPFTRSYLGDKPDERAIESAAADLGLQTETVRKVAGISLVRMREILELPIPVARAEDKLADGAQRDEEGKPDAEAADIAGDAERVQAAGPPAEAIEADVAPAPDEPRADERTGPKPPEGLPREFMVILRQHALHGYALGREVGRIRHELAEVFKGLRVTSRQIDEGLGYAIATAGIPGEEATVEPPKLRPAEWTDFTNKPKTGSRDWYLGHLWRNIHDKSKAHMRLAVLTGAECHELDPLIRMGIPPEMIHPYMLPGDPLAVSTLIRNAQAAGVHGWRIENMRTQLPKETQPYYGGNVDAFTYYDDEFEKILQLMPCPEDGEAYWNFNFMAKRERKETVKRFHTWGALFRGAQRLREAKNFAEFFDNYVEVHIEGRENPAPTKEDRRLAMPVEIERNLGAARQERWLCRELLLEMGQATDEHPEWDDYDAERQFEVIMKNFERAGNVLMRRMASCLGQEEKLHPLFGIAIGSALPTMAINVALNLGSIKSVERHEYVSPQNHSPFLSNFIVIKFDAEQKKRLLRSTEFFLSAIVHTLAMHPNCEKYGGLFRIEGEGDEGSLVYEDPVSWIQHGMGVDNDFEGKFRIRIPLTVLHDDLLAYMLKTAPDKVPFRMIWKDDAPDARPPFSVTIVSTAESRKVLEGMTQEEIIEMMKPQIDAWRREHPDATELRIAWMSPDEMARARREGVTTSFHQIDLPEKQKAKIPPPPRPQPLRHPAFRMPHLAAASQSRKPIGRNEPCPCCSGKKYKQCCINKKKADDF
jgi:hypothetical protein